MSYKSWITVLQLKTNFSVVLQGVVDSESRFIFTDIGAYGKQSDGGTFSGSTLYHFLEDFESTLPKPPSFKRSGTAIPFAILGDEAYPLNTYLMKPFARKDMSCEERVLNCGLSPATRCVERAFGILTVNWRLLNKAIETNTNKAERIVRCIFLQHNMIIDTAGTTHDPSVFQETSQIHGCRQDKTNVSGRSFSRSSKRATDVYAFKAHFNGPTAAILSRNQQVYL